MLRDCLQKWKVECRADSLVPMRFAIFRLHLSKLLRLPRKSDARSYEVLHLSREIISANLKIWCSKMQPFSGNQRISDEHVVFFNILTWACASRHNAVHLYQHLNFQKCSEPGVFCAFCLRNVLRATTACNFSSLISPDGSAPAALASSLFDPPEPQIIGKTKCFATVLPFRAPASSVFWLFLFSDFFFFSSLLFSSRLFSSLLFSPLLFWLFPPLLFHLCLLSEVWLLNFLRPVSLRADTIVCPRIQRPQHVHIS